MAKSTDRESEAEKPEKRRNAPTRISAELPSLTKMAFRKTLGGRGFAEAGLITEWAAIVGADVARMSQPVHLAFPRGERKGGVLTIQCGGAAALEMQHLKPQILERINSHFGYTAIADLRFRQGSVAPRGKTSQGTKSGNRSKSAGGPPDSRPITAEDKAAVAAALRGVPEGGIKASLERIGLAVRRRRPVG
ncbi:MAG TPA: DciA family protein [Dongiaceae bacterium]